MPLPYEHPLWHSVMGEALHPGGTALSLRLLGLCGFSPGTAVLDAGCGGGATLELLRKRGVRAVGLDRSADLLCRATAKGPVVEGDLRRIPFEAGAFEGVVCECVLSLQKSLFPVLGEIARVLRRGGRLGVTDLFVREGGSCGGSGETCADGARPRREMESALRRHGFEPLFFEDHSALLRECTAKLVWTGILEAPRGPCRSLGYGLWICRKNHSEAPLGARGTGKEGDTSRRAAYVPDALAGPCRPRNIRDPLPRRSDMEHFRTAVTEWAREGYCCSQIMILAGLAYTGRENPDLVASLGGLCKGGYVPWGTCGALSGACCLLGFYAGKGSPWEQKDPRLLLMAEELHRWFRERWGAGGERVGCADILGNTAALDPLACSSMVAATLEKTLHLLEEQGFDLREGRPS